MPALAQATIHVPADQPTIQAAINVSSSGDTVLVAPGTYYENIDFKGKAITLTSEGGASATTIDGGGKDTVVSFRAGETSASVISGFTITNGYSTFNGPNNGYGGGIYVSNASPTILNNTIRNNKGCEGVGIFSSQGAPTIKNNSITNNVQTGCSGGIGGGGIGLLGYFGTIQVIGNVITNNHADDASGGGIGMFGAGPVLVEDNIISGNTSYNFGGGIEMVNRCDAQIINNLIVGNKTTQSGGGVYFSVPGGEPSPLLLGNTIADNSASAGSGVYSVGFDENAQILNNVITTNLGQSVIFCDTSYDNESPVLQFNDLHSNGVAPSSNCGSPVGANGNISVDPLFVASDVGNYHLQPTSPLVDAGNNAYTGIPASDLAGSLRIYDGNGDGTATIDIGAFEYAGTTSTQLSTPSVFFPDQPVGTVSDPIAVTLTNTGSTTLDVSSISAPTGFSQTNTCRVSAGIPAGQSCTISFVFAPTTQGTIGGNAVITSNGSGGPLQIALSGNGAVTTVQLGPTAINMGAQPVGTTSQPFALQVINVGSVPLAVTKVAVTGDFAVTNNCTAWIRPYSQCTIQVTFTPTAAWTRNGTLTITDNGVDSPQQVPITGFGLAPQIVITPSSWTFPTQNVGTSSTAAQLTVLNVGNYPLTISALQISGDYSQTNDCMGYVGPNASCKVWVTFTPTLNGNRTGTLTFTDNAAASPQTVLLSGTGVGPDVTISPSPVVFGGQTLVGSTSSPMAVTYKDTGSNVVSVLSIAAPTAEFTQTNNCPYQLPGGGYWQGGYGQGAYGQGVLVPGAYCTITVRFSPLATGTRTGTLVIYDSASGGWPRTVTLSGLGANPVPVLSTVSPQTLIAGSSGTVLTVTGSSFQPTSVVTWNGSNRATTYVSAAQLTATILASDIAATGTAQVTVITPTPGGGTSAPATVTISAPVAATIISPAPSTTLPGSSVTFTWSGSGPSAYELWIGTAPGAWDISYNPALTASTQSLQTNVPATGAPVYVRLWSYMNGTWKYNDYTYTAAGSLSKGMITAPTPSTTLPGTSVNFTWSGSGSSAYELWIGTIPGAWDISYNPALTASTQSLQTNVPATGAPVYVRLWSFMNGTWQYNDYTYTAAGGAIGVITSPAANTMLPGTTVTFNWSGNGPSRYELWIGSIPGAWDLSYNPNLPPTTQSLQTTIPAAPGSTVYVRLWSYMNGTWQPNDYTYTASN